MSSNSKYSFNSDDDYLPFSTDYIISICYPRKMSLVFCELERFVAERCGNVALIFQAWNLSRSLSLICIVDNIHPDCLSLASLVSL